MSKTIREVLKSMYYKGKDGEGLSDHELDQALSDIRRLLEGEAVNFELDIDSEIIAQKAVPLEAINKIIGDTE